MDWELYKERSKITQKVRTFFTERSYLEVDTPLMSPDLIPESSIEIFKTTLIHPFKDNKDFYLIPSPEIWMKKLLSQGSGDIFQICKSFRNSEQTGNHHNPEFTMLEWYKTDYNYLDNIKETEDLFSYLLDEDSAVDLKPPFIRLSMEEAFRKHAGFSLEENQNVTDLQRQCLNLEILYDEEDDWEVLFNRIFLEKVEPGLPVHKPVALYNYPSKIKTLAAEIKETPWSQRWELYVRGIELANCFTEEANGHKIQEYFEEEKKMKDQFSPVSHPVDPDYHKYFGKSFPSCSGVALGMDRLIMVLLNQKSLKDVIMFPTL